MKRKLTRRDFIRLTGCAAAIPYLPFENNQKTQITLVTEPADPVANTPPVRWALNQLDESLKKLNVTVTRSRQVRRGQFCIVASGSQLNSTQSLLKRSGVRVADKPESLSIVPTKENILLACGADSRGLVYALLELADRVNNSTAETAGLSPATLAALEIKAPVSEQPTNAIRSVLRLFASDVEDKPWFNDRDFWSDYLTMLATHRFNRFNLSLSLGYDFLRRVTDAYFLFPYPFLFSVPGYNVRVSQLSDTERDRNLAMLKFISEQTVARGLDFQLGLWMHGYEWIDSPNANYTIEGLTKDTHGPYCRDALRQLLQSCPSISGVTIRTHGESGVEEGSYQFWKTLFDGVATCGRRVEIDLHPKGLDETMLRNALATKQPVTVSPKFWAEHLGLPYHQADIRQLEVPDPNKQTSRLMNLSEGSRSFMRYGYGDLLREDRTWKVMHRVWPGSQRLLLWGDPSSAATYSNAFTFCGSDGAELMEPLTFKGRRGSGIGGDRCAYADTSLRTRWDFQKYEYTYRLWGRLLYNPKSDPDVWRRSLTKQFVMVGPRASSLSVAQNIQDFEDALANASRILPLITTAHLPSAANNLYWPEMYLNHSLIDAAHPGSYSDTPAPKVFGNVSPLDPQLFYRINDYADDLLKGEVSGKYSPLEVAQWLDDYADAASQALLRAITRFQPREPSAEFKRLTSDVIIQLGLGRFFAAKFRAAVLYRAFEKTGDSRALTSALHQYRQAREHWAESANIAKNVYMANVTVGELPQLHGHWIDRLAAIDNDLAILQTSEVHNAGQQSASASSIISKVLGRVERRELSVQHMPEQRFVPGKPFDVEVKFDEPLTWARFYYRHVNQAERFNVADMKRHGNVYHSTIPADYTHTNYPLQYYFEMKTQTGETLLYPGLSKTLMQQPYIIVRRA